MNLSKIHEILFLFELNSSALTHTCTHTLLYVGGRALNYHPTKYTKILYIRELISEIFGVFQSVHLSSLM